MVLRNIKKIQDALPEVIHIVMFYDNGTIFQSTFSQEINIPKLGENISELILHIRRVYEISNFKWTNYKELIFETDDISIAILKLGEESNLALFFKKEEGELEISPIKRYIARIENLIDMDKSELILQDLIAKEQEIQALRNDLQNKQLEIEKLRDNYKSLEAGMQKEEKKLLDDLGSLETDSRSLKQKINDLKQIYDNLKEKFKKE
ncbi:MAG: hypothetical protein GF353_26695 [Candidatus Lokiarchaeota archaeon]|nr:hypothetical protein [Candidatus Lokiarchaeota archaeon]